MAAKTLASEGPAFKIPAMQTYEYVLIGLGVVLIVIYFIVKKNQKQ
ncbi:MAG TPA: hypothetical protein VHX86_10950 [Tepidisphaeraceae bacterium]|nr:hypothetical protein [Tepidisphaeraceae bacterium]